MKAIAWRQEAEAWRRRGSHADAMGAGGMNFHAAVRNCASFALRAGEYIIRGIAMLRLRLYLLSTATLSMAAAALVAPAPAHAETYHTCKGFIDSVPATISQQGVWCLRQDLSTGITSGTAITVNTSNVTIDCNDFKLGGLAAGAGTGTLGIHANGQFNVSVRNCSIRGFLYGVTLEGGGAHLVERNGLDGNTYMGISVSGPGSMIRSNRVVDTGGSTTSAYGIFAANGVDVVDNTVNGVAATDTNGSAFGIYSSANGEASIAHNRVRGLAAASSGSTYGIFNANSGRLSVRDNDVQGTGVVGSIGVRCFTNTATARDNVVAGFETGVANCLLYGNTVNAN
ncbi:hypothetical protein [Luteimonas salinilitoris]|uniref:Right-handed parallel beta-helix repeat-containing protein n=1 Tax=Luteimonas salinilitoris TaxID=3237697 RepID=A0ABV4HM52_9GAMM